MVSVSAAPHPDAPVKGGPLLLRGRVLPVDKNTPKKELKEASKALQRNLTESVEAVDPDRMLEAFDLWQAWVRARGQSLPNNVYAQTLQGLATVLGVKPSHDPGSSQGTAAPMVPGGVAPLKDSDDATTSTSTPARTSMTEAGVSDPQQSGDDESPSTAKNVAIDYPRTEKLYSLMQRIFSECASPTDSVFFIVLRAYGSHPDGNLAARLSLEIFQKLKQKRGLFAKAGGKAAGEAVQAAAEGHSSQQLSCVAAKGAGDGVGAVASADTTSSSSKSTNNSSPPIKLRVFVALLKAVLRVSDGTNLVEEVFQAELNPVFTPNEEERRAWEQIFALRLEAAAATAEGKRGGCGESFSSQQGLGAGERASTTTGARGDGTPRRETAVTANAILCELSRVCPCISDASESELRQALARIGASVEETTVDGGTGVCATTGVRLGLEDCEKAQLRSLLTQIERLATEGEAVIPTDRQRNEKMERRELLWGSKPSPAKASSSSRKQTF